MGDLGVFFSPLVFGYIYIGCLLVCLITYSYHVTTYHKIQVYLYEELNSGGRSFYGAYTERRHMITAALSSAKTTKETAFTSKRPPLISHQQQKLRSSNRQTSLGTATHYNNGVKYLTEKILLACEDAGTCGGHEYGPPQTVFEAETEGKLTRGRCVDTGAESRQTGRKAQLSNITAAKTYVLISPSSPCRLQLFQ